MNKLKENENNEEMKTRDRLSALLTLILICLVIGFTAIIALLLYLR